MASDSARDRTLRGWLVHVGPMLALAIIPILGFLLDLQLAARTSAWIAVVATVALFVAWLVEWRVARFTSMLLDIGFALAWLPVVMLWRDAGGGSASGYGPLVLGPLAYVALHGSRTQVYACVAGIAAVFLGPPFVLSSDMYPLEQELRRGTIWIAAGLVSGIAINRIVALEARGRRDLARERAFLRAVFDNMQDGVAALDGAGSDPVINDALRDMYGVDERTDPDLARSPLQRALAGEHIRREPFEVERGDGTRRDVEASASPIIVFDEVILGSVMTLHDVTAQREAERMKDQFFALVSHELRTPLAAIVGYLELLEEAEHDNLTGDGREYLAVMQRNSQRLMRLIGDLLFAAQVDAGALTLVRGPVDLARVARDAHDTARVRAVERDQEVVLDLPPSDTDLTCVGDRDRLGQALDNLLTNAIKFTPDGGTIVVGVRRRTDATIEVEVRDTGRGIPAEEQARLFERFARARSADEDAVQGVGLGLAITKAIVDAHGGSIDLESEVGVGTTFRVRLPTRAEHA